MKVLHTIGALCFIGCMMSCQSVKNKITEKSGIDSLASNPFITHMYTADPFGACMGGWKTLYLCIPRYRSSTGM